MQKDLFLMISAIVFTANSVFATEKEGEEFLATSKSLIGQLSIAHKEEKILIDPQNVSATSTKKMEDSSIKPKACKTILLDRHR